MSCKKHNYDIFKSFYNHISHPHLTDTIQLSPNPIKQTNCILFLPSPSHLSYRI